MSGLQGIVDFILEAGRLKEVTRAIKPRGLDRYENPAEHSWQVALLAIPLARYAAEPVDVARVVRMLLVHDVGEVDTGDTNAFVEGGWEERKAAELACVGRIFGALEEPARGELLALWREFEEGTTADARFANAIDRAMPVLMNLSNEGQSWRDHGISHERVVRRVRPQIEGGCPALWAYLEARLEEAKVRGLFAD